MTDTQKSTACAVEIRRVAKTLFAERGYDSVSISDIADQAACSKANIFHHFGSKEGLYFDVMRQVMQRSAARIREVMADDKDARTRLTQTVKDHYAMLAEDPERSRLIMREVMFSSPQRGQELASEVFGEQFSALTELLSGLHSKGTDNPEFLAFMLIAANVMLFHCNNVLQFLPGTEFASDVDVYAENLSEMLLHSLDVRASGTA